MTKTKKTIIALLTVVMVVCLGLFTFTACKKTPAVLDSIKITTKPATTSYVVGETFKEEGIVVTAYYTKGRDKTEKVLERKNYDLSVEAKFLDSSGKFKLAEGETRASVKITVSYTEKEVTKTATTNVSLTKPVKSITLSDGVEYKDEYFAGQFFDASGIKIDVVYLDDTTEDEIEIIVTGDDANATIDPADAIPSGTEKIVLIYGGKSIDLPITLKLGVWIEGETGLFNGEYIEQKTTSDGGKLGVDAGLSNAQEGAVSFFIAQAKADYALSELKKTEGFDEAALKAQPSKLYTTNQYFKKDNITVNGEKLTALYDEIVSWISKNGTKVTEYLRENGYEKWTEDGTEVVHEATKLNEYLESEQYQADVAHYRANNDFYLGGVSQGSTVSFVFDSDGAGAGSISFRLASCYLCLDNGNWGPIAMGDIYLKQFAEVYINGVQYEIGDDVFLPGGMTPDGSNNQQLWANWEEVELDNIAFLEGRNVIELKIKNHGITAPAQTSYSWSVNVDSMYLKPAADAGCTLGTYDNSIEIEIAATPTEVKAEKKEDAAIVTVSGDFTAKRAGVDVKGYIADQIHVTIDGKAVSVVTADGKFTATYDVTDFAINAEDESYAIIVEEEPVNVTVADTVVSVGYNKYNLENSEDKVVLKVTSDAEISKITATGVKLEKADNSGDVYLVITGKVEWKLYSAEDVAEYINASLGTGDGSFDFQNTTGNARTVYNAADRIITVANAAQSGAEGAAAADYVADLIVKVNVTDKMTAAGQFAIHFNGGNFDFLTQSEKDAAKPESLTDAYKALFDLSKVDMTPVEVGYYTYTLAYEPWFSSQTKWGKDSNERAKHYYGCVGLNVQFDAELSTTGVSADLAVENGKVVYIVNGTYTFKKYTEEEIKELIGKIAIDFQGNPYMQSGSWDGNWDTHSLVDMLISVTIDSKTEGDGTTYTYQAKYDITSLGSSNYCYTGHYFCSTGPNNGDFKPNVESFTKEVNLGGKKFTLSYTKGGGDGDFWGCVGLIISDTDQPDTPDSAVPEPPVTDALNGTTWVGEDATETIYTLTFADGAVTVQKEGEEAVNGTYTGTTVIVEGYAITVNDNDTITLVLDEVETEITLTKVTESDGE